MDYTCTLSPCQHQFSTIYARNFCMPIPRVSHGLANVICYRHYWTLTTKLAHMQGAQQKEATAQSRNPLVEYPCSDPREVGKRVQSSERFWLTARSSRWRRSSATLTEQRRSCGSKDPVRRRVSRPIWDQYIPPMPPPPPAGIGGSGSGTSVTRLSVVSIRAATEAAFCSALLDTLVGSMMPRSIMST